MHVCVNHAYTCFCRCDRLFLFVFDFVCLAGWPAVCSFCCLLVDLLDLSCLLCCLVWFGLGCMIWYGMIRYGKVWMYVVTHVSSHVFLIPPSSKPCSGACCWMVSNRYLTCKHPELECQDFIRAPMQSEGSGKRARVFRHSVELNAGEPIEACQAALSIVSLASTSRVMVLPVKVFTKICIAAASVELKLFGVLRGTGSPTHAWAEKHLCILSVGFWVRGMRRVVGACNSRNS